MIPKKKKKGRPRSSEVMKRVRMPTRIADAIHKAAVLADYQTDWEYIEAKCL